MTEFEELPEFSRDLKNISKKYRSIYQDLGVLKKALTVKNPYGVPGTERISGLGAGVSLPIYKVRHFRCASLKGKGSRSGIRVIYAFKEDEDKIIFIEMYHKNDQSNHNRERILMYFNS